MTIRRAARPSAPGRAPWTYSSETVQRLADLARRPAAAGRGTRDVAPRGVRALFVGPSRTDKSRAARDLAASLGLDPYRIDLSAVVSKQVGETEKNLSRVFDQAEAGTWVLFFDEADALFRKRTDVRDAHDRFANLEVGSLLQRIEERGGAVVVACESEADIDPAFLRRFDAVVEFPRRSRPARRRLPRP